MERLRAEHEIDEGRAIEDRLSLLARDTTADADNNVGTHALQRTPASELAEHFLLRLFANGTRVEHEQIGRGRVLGTHVAVRGGKQIGDARRVVLVHLTAE